MTASVHIVHCVDTEGPLFEGLDAKFERLERICGVRLEPTPENWDMVMRGQADLGAKADLVREVFTSHLNRYMEDWEQVDAMLEGATAPAFRLGLPDSEGQGYAFSWFCMDHAGYKANPRRRATGYHAIFDHYQALLARSGNGRDGIHWHFHPMSTYKEANRCATSLLNSPEVIEALTRRVIERHWFPSCYRAGFHAERPDIHWFLEQFVPFDLSNTSVENPGEIERHGDFAGGRFGDWRRAPRDWSPYHPAHDDYQTPGQCRRWIARCLNVLNRFAGITQAEVDRAFVQAREGRPALLAIGSHDWRDLRPEVDHFRSLIASAARRFPGVPFKYCDALEAMRAVALGGRLGEPLKLRLALARDGRGRPVRLSIETASGKVFGPQPFLALQTRSGRFIHDNLDFSTDLRSWSYAFDADTVPPEDLEAVGVGAADQYGNTFVEVLRSEVLVAGAGR